jgi:hypothetical protein
MRDLSCAASATQQFAAAGSTRYPPTPGLEIRAIRVECSVGRGSRRRAKAGGMDDPNWLFCIRLAFATCVDEQLSLVLLVRSGTSVEVGSASATPGGAAL